MTDSSVNAEFWSDECVLLDVSADELDSRLPSSLCPGTPRVAPAAASDAIFFKDDTLSTPGDDSTPGGGAPTPPAPRGDIEGILLRRQESMSTTTTVDRESCEPRRELGLAARLRRMRGSGGPSGGAGEGERGREQGCEGEGYLRPGKLRMRIPGKDFRLPSRFSFLGVCVVGVVSFLPGPWWGYLIVISMF